MVGELTEDHFLGGSGGLRTEHHVQPRYRNVLRLALKGKHVLEYDIFKRPTMLDMVLV